MTRPAKLTVRNKQIGIRYNMYFMQLLCYITYVTELMLLIPYSKTVLEVRGTLGNISLNCNLHFALDSKGRHAGQTTVTCQNKGFFLLLLL